MDVIITTTAWAEKIVMYKRYIDDLLFIWKEEEADFYDFLDFLNFNQWGLSFSGSISKSHLEYLDIEFSTSGTEIV